MNIERSLQRNNSSAAIKQLRALSAVGVEADKFDREKWRVQLGPMLELWQQMVSSSPGVLAKRDQGQGGPGGGNKQAGGGATLDPVDDFVSMESTLSGRLCNLVDGALVARQLVEYALRFRAPDVHEIVGGAGGWGWWRGGAGARLCWEC